MSLPVVLPTNIKIPDSVPDPSLHTAEIEQRKIENERDERLSGKLRETIVYVLNLVFLIWICSANRDSNFFYQNTSLKEALSITDEIQVLL